MKFLIYLLSFCILSISSMTCEDADAVVVHENKGLFIETGHSNSNTDLDNCSPLCTCNCCGQPSFLSFGYPLEKPTRIAISNSPITLYNKKFVSDYSQSIWQPPKLNKVLIG